MRPESNRQLMLIFMCGRGEDGVGGAVFRKRKER
jgi:hypothetical protein